MELDRGRLVDWVSCGEKRGAAVLCAALGNRMKLLPRYRGTLARGMGEEKARELRE